MTKFVLTGSTGQLGSRVLQHLLKLGVKPEDIALSAFDIKRVPSEIKNKGIEIRHGDYKRKETLEKSFVNADVLFLISTTTISVDERTVEHKNAIEVAKKLGIKHIFYTSTTCGDTRETQIKAAHIDTEDLLKASGLKFTIIREGIYSEAYSVFAGYFDPAATMEIIIPADGAISFASREDLAKATAKLLFSHSEYENQTITLTGSRNYTISQIAVLLSNILDRIIPVRIVSMEEYIERNIKAQNESWVHLWATTYGALERGELARVSSTLEKLLGRPLISFEETLKAMLAH